MTNKHQLPGVIFSLAAIAANLALCRPTLAQMAPQPEQSAELSKSLRPAPDQIQTIDVAVSAEHRPSFSMMLDGQQITFELQPHSLRSKDFRVQTRDASGKLSPATPRPIETYRGVSREDADVQAALTVKDGQVSGLITAKQVSWWIQPLDAIDATAHPKQHAVYRQDELIPGDWMCGADLLHAQGPVGQGGIAGPTGLAGCLQKAQIAFDADFEYYQFFDLPKALDPVADTVADIESIMNAVDFIYRRDTAITYEITTVLVQIAEPDPYQASASGDLLEEFRVFWETNHTDIIRDVAHLFTGKDVDGNVIGVAYLSGVCNGDIAYGLSQSRFTSLFAWRVRLTAHELGHNWSAPHCNQGAAPCLDTCNIMCSSVSGCVQGFEEFEACSRAAIIAHRDAIADQCLDVAGDVSFQATRYTAPEVLAGDRFGTSVAMDGDVAIVGSYTDDGTANDIGSAYVLRYSLETGTWIQEAQLLASDAQGNDRFGISVDIADYEGGEVAVIGAFLEDDNGRDAGAAYIFRNTGGGWVQEDKLVAKDTEPFDLFGRSVSVTRSGQTDLVIVGAYLHDDVVASTGSAYIFRNSGSGWVEEQKLNADDLLTGDQFGISVAISANEGNELAIVGAYNDDGQSTDAGSAYVFQNTGKWSQVAHLFSTHPIETDQFGYSVDISAGTESRAIVGAWKVDGTSSNVGEAFLYANTGGGWAFEQQLQPLSGEAEAFFGCAVAIRNDTALVGSYLADNAAVDGGAAFLYRRVGLGWTQEAVLTPSPAGANDQFGIAVAIGSADQVIIGSWADDGAGADGGAIYITSGSEFLDCNKNTIPDSCDIASGKSLDVNADGIPDECQKPPPTCPADVAPFPEGDGAVDVDDLLVIINGWGDCPSPPVTCPADVAPPDVGDGVVDVDDLLVIINGWGACPK